MVFSLDFADLIALISAIREAENLSQKLAILHQRQEVQEYLAYAKPINAFVQGVDDETQMALLSVIAIGEAPVVFQGWQEEKRLQIRLRELAAELIETERFYDSIGGIIGYHKTVCELMRNRNDKLPQTSHFLQPPRIEIGEGASNHDVFVEWGITGLPLMGEIYPVGGAGDRLNLIEPSTGEPLPAAELPFAGRTLLELLVRDLQGRELLYEKLTGTKLITPIVLMTSMEKDNDRRIREICVRKQWFERPRDSFYFIVQPLVPVVTIEGHWVMDAPFKLYRKPGGHGVLWKLMEDQGAFDWLEKQGRTKALVRQINNPLAGEDDGLLAFTGIGLHEDKAFGFASCPRKLRASEGMNVLVKEEKERKCRLTNIEYTHFDRWGVEDVPDKEGSAYSKFPANTNILFVDLKEIRSLIPSCPFPGMLVNLKSTVPYRMPDGAVRQLHAGRLESTMQNIANMIVFESEEAQEQPVYLTYNRREKTIGTAKCSFDPRSDSDETPEICFYTLLSLHRDLLEHLCGMQVPQFVSREEYLKTGPNLLFLFNPALGPNYRLVGQKIRRGRLSEGAELQVELSDLDMEALTLSGSLLITGDCRRSSCRLQNVTVANQGIDRDLTIDFWKNSPVRKEAMEIILEGDSEFFAQNVVFQGSHRIVVPDGIRMIAFEKEGRLVLREEAVDVDKSSWRWNYRLSEDQSSTLKIF